MTSKVWFITGASRGFGRVWAEAALKRGDLVVATARDPRALDELAETYGDAVLVLPLDVTNREAVFEVVNQAHRHFERLDVILCNAGYGYMGAIEELEHEQVRANFDTNVFGTLSVIQAALPILRQQGSGHVFTVSSIGGVIGFPTGGSYTASKFAIEAMSEALAGEVAAFGIKVTIIEPGHFATEFRSSVRSPRALEAYDPIRQTVRSSFKPDDFGDPAATATAIFDAVDAEEPPLRLVLGSTTIAKFRAAYAARMSNWDKWEAVSNAAQGRQPA
ncbi:SDR family NAD(P)-dependent oxidoreductase [Burkholderia multivorans]|uniref:SDR family NAD(P)-dependent oxidoreductase n=1 Tax=Burkholderia multivorans TaxID=87883 RepID=UPI0021C11D61|nr:SDR family NAD(P)-dependent oxidoreductase [Burkholderia multivorans]MDR8761992.1 putative oxidoreductase [Burkholderia multivorans]MDR8766206.1 putative oxidoreductase [Burkholderia multivorans]MDR8770007.1 putative oxidoreductase [Burkholderia multivorans]MDR8792038.1 putative oxidoreductase [Burkholderia multivorans]MDR8794561.1 putative oxidoreductase [Burkholderia multivorans]